MSWGKGLRASELNSSVSKQLRASAAAVFDGLESRTLMSGSADSSPYFQFTF